MSCAESSTSHLPAEQPLRFSCQRCNDTPKIHAVVWVPVDALGPGVILGILETPPGEGTDFKARCATAALAGRGPPMYVAGPGPAGTPISETDPEAGPRRLLRPGIRVGADPRSAPGQTGEPAPRTEVPAALWLAPAACAWGPARARVLAWP